MGIYGHKFDNLLEASWNVKGTDDKYIVKIKKDKGKIEKIVNKICKENFQSFCDSLKNGSYAEDAEEFRKGKSPIVKSFEKNTDYVEIQLKYFSGWNDTQLFFQDYIIEKLNNDPELKSLGYHFSGDDYLGIYVHLRKDMTNESFGSSFEGFGKGETNETKDKSHNESPLMRKVKEMPPSNIDSKELDKPIAKYVDIKESAYMSMNQIMTLGHQILQQEPTKHVLSYWIKGTNYKDVDDMIKNMRLREYNVHYNTGDIHFSYDFVNLPEGHDLKNKRYNVLYNTNTGKMSGRFEDVKIK